MADPRARDRWSGAPPGPDELHGGPDRVPIRPPRWLRVTVVGTVLAASAIAVGRGYPATRVPPGPTPAVSTVVAVGATGPHERSCIRTDNRTWLNVSFVLANTGNVAVTVQGVKATLPLAGLRAAGAVISGGTCSRRTGEPPGGRLAVGSSLLVTLGFEVPERCPQPIPVEATLTVQTDDGHTSTHVVPVLQDLGQVPFRQCRRPTANAPLGSVGRPAAAR